MTVDVKHNGLSLAARTLEFTVPMSPEPIGTWSEMYAPNPTRTVTLTLVPGETWVTAGPSLRRGQWVRMDFNGEPFDGRVLFRRLGKLVLVGQFVSKRA